MSEVESVVRQLGGSTAVARSLGVNRNTVIRWVSTQRVSSRAVLQFHDLAKKHGVKVKLSDLIGGQSCS